MFCRNCGNQIEEDSVFCKYCGKIVSLENTLSQNKGISIRFLELSKSKQIAIIIYGIWMLGWLCFLIANADEHHFVECYVMLFFLSTFFFPFVFIGGWHIYKITRERNEYTNSSENNEAYSIQSHIQLEKINSKESILPITTGQDSKEDQLISSRETDVYPRIIFSELLLKFARKNGKMQLVSKKISDGYHDHYCQFTSEDGKIIRVNFTERTGGLSSKEISEKKSQLMVNKLADGTYCLDFIDDKQIDDSLPF